MGHQRAYQRSHPWLSFRLDTRQFPPPLWMKLGEAASKCDHVAGVPLRPEVQDELHRIYLAKGVLATTAIEGNTLSEDQVRAYLEGELRLPPSKEYLETEIGNIVGACHWMAAHVLGGSAAAVAITPELVKEYNRRVLDGLAVDQGVVPGVIRRTSVGVAGYRGAPAEDCEHLVARLCDWLNDPAFEPWPGARVEMALVKAIIAHLYLAWIHPFGDGNGRTARLVELHLLIGAGVPVPSAHLLSDHYNVTRAEYYRQLDRASGSGGDVVPFVEYAVRGFVDGLVAQLATIRDQQWDVTWRNYVHERFKDRHTEAGERQRRLVLDLSRLPEGAVVPVSGIEEISARVARAFAGRTKKTLTRDLAALAAMGLVEVTSAGVRARKESILAFLPRRRPRPAPR